MSSVKKTCTEQNRNIPNGWLETTLGEVSKVQTGPFGSQLKNEQYITGGTPVITVEHIQDFRIQDFDYPSVTEEDKNRLSKYLLKEGDIVFTRVGSVDLSAYVDKAQDEWMFSSRMLSVRTNDDIDSKFLSYFFRQSSFRKYIYRISVGATMPSINTGILKSIPISYPPLPEQKAIANILTAFDDKIDNLQAQNKTLEQTAQTIFKEWFGKYQVGDELPDDWRIGEINNLVEFVIDNRGKTPPLIDESNESYPLIEVNSITGNDRNVNLNLGKKFVDEKTYLNWFRKGHPQNGDVLLSTVGSIGQLAQVFNEKICIAQNIVALRSNALGNFLYELLKRNQKLIINLDISSVQPSIKVPHLLSMPVVIPKLELIQQFDKVVDKLTNKITSNYQQIQTLKKTRDTLLPKLMSGQVRVNEF